MNVFAGAAQDTDSGGEPANPLPDAPRSERPGRSSRAPAIGAAALILLPGALTVFLSFRGGGFFAGTTGLVAAALTVVLILRVTLASRPFEGLRPPVSAAGAGLGLLAVWTLASAWWSDSASRALLSFDRTLLYALLVVVIGSVAWLPRSLRSMLRAVAFGIVVVCLAALATRTLPDVWHAAPNLRDERLSYPLTYWNALGVMAAIGLVLCLHLTSDSAEPRWSRVMSAAAIPVLTATLLFTYSRGAIAAAAVGLLLYLAAARPRGAISGLLVAVPAAAIAAVVAYRADLLAKPDFGTSHDAVAQGHRVALAVAVCALCAALLRFALTRVDARIARIALPRLDRRTRIAAAIGLPLAIVGAAVALGAPHAIGRQYDRFSHGDAVGERGDFRARLANAGNNGRIEHWRVALEAFDSAPARGTGGGTYQVRWLRDRRVGFTAVNAHSLYLETLAELGVVGLGLLALALGGLFFGVAARARGGERALHAAVLAALATWALHAGVDWDWQMPAVTVGVLALAAAATAAPPADRRKRRKQRLGPAGRVWLAAAALVVGAAPALVAVSQQRLDASVRAFQSGDCAGAIDHALGSLGALSVRPEPLEVISYCDARLGLTRLSTAAMKSAIARDPQNWELRYGLGIVRGAGRLDPRPAVRQALRLNPKESLVRTAAQRFDTESRSRWARAARELPIPIRRGRPR